MLCAVYDGERFAVFRRQQSHAVRARHHRSAGTHHFSKLRMSSQTMRAMLSASLYVGSSTEYLGCWRRAAAFGSAIPAIAAKDALPAACGRQLVGTASKTLA